MLRFLWTAFLLFLPLLVLETVVGGTLLYLGLNPDDTAELLKRALVLAGRIQQTLISEGIRFYGFVGINEGLSRTLASISALVIILVSYAPIVWLIMKVWRFEMRTWKKLAELWRNRKVAPP